MQNKKKDNLFLNIISPLIDTLKFFSLCFITYQKNLIVQKGYLFHVNDVLLPKT
jgi:hypothetical protein